MKLSLYRILLTIALLYIAPCIVAQSNANDYLDKVVEQFSKSPGIMADFAIQGDTGSGIYMHGTIKMQDKKFCIETNDMTTWYDGKTMWTYAPSICEVNITTPTRQELTEINPYLILEDCKQSFIAKELDSKQSGERQFRLTPTKRNTNITNIILTVATSNNAPISFEILSNNNQRMLVSITNYNNNAKIPQSAFTFDKNKYPQADIIDLR